MQKPVSTFFEQELISLIRSNWLILAIIPILAAGAVFAAQSLREPEYTSIAYLRMNGSDANTFEALMTSPTMANSVISGVPAAGQNPESRARYLRENMKLTDIEPLGGRSEVRLFRLSVTLPDPDAAQATNKNVIDAWLDTTRPAPQRQQTIEAEIARLKQSSAANDDLIKQIMAEAENLVLPNSQAGEIASPISALISKRNAELTAIDGLKNELGGVPREVVVAEPHLPQAPAANSLALPILALLAAIPLALALVLVARFVRTSASTRSMKSA